MVDRSLLLRKVAELDTYLGQVRGYSGVALAEYQADWKTQRVVERTLQMMIESCADIAHHLIADGGFRAPTSYSDAFKVLHENGAIDDRLLPVMEKMAKFRNILVHQYESVDAEIVVLILKRHLSDFEAFRDAVLAHIRS